MKHACALRLPRRYSIKRCRLTMRCAPSKPNNNDCKDDNTESEMQTDQSRHWGVASDVWHGPSKYKLGNQQCHNQPMQKLCGRGVAWIVWHNAPLWNVASLRTGQEVVGSKVPTSRETSALGQKKQAFASQNVMATLPPMTTAKGNSRKKHVRIIPDSGHVQRTRPSPLWAYSGQVPASISRRAPYRSGQARIVSACIGIGLGDGPSCAGPPTHNRTVNCALLSPRPYQRLARQL